MSSTVSCLLPTVDFCGLSPTRLLIGANPFGGFSHQGKARNEEMLAWNTVERIKETWRRAEGAGLNTMITNNESPHVVQAVREYLAEGGALQWIAQLNCIRTPDMTVAIDQAVEIGARAVYFHGRRVEEMYGERDEARLRGYVEHAHGRGLRVGVAGHAPEVHYWVDGLDLVDFHCVPFFNCGSLHSGEGEKFHLRDIVPATEAIRRIRRPCVAYKVMGAGRIDPRMALEYAYERIKPGDVVNVGMHRGDKDDMVEENAALVREILGAG